jgi:hypothetical protein
MRVLSPPLRLAFDVFGGVCFNLSSKVIILFLYII